MTRRPVRRPSPSDSSDDDDYEPYDENPPPDRPSKVMLIGIWAIFAPPLLFAIPVLVGATSGAFDSLMRLIAGGYTLLAILVLGFWTKHYFATPAPRRRGPDEGPDEEEEDDVWDEDAEEI